ncbi:MAG: YceI family protein [Arenimonas sp.]
MRALLFLFLLATNAVEAADWRVLPGSSLGFTARYQAEAFGGHFAKFTPQIRFDPTRLGDSRFDVVIDLASVDTRNQERDDMLRTPEFFNSRKQAQARFLASKFRALGGNRFIADGVLSLHGVSKPVSLSFTWAATAKPVLTGEARLRRLDFGIGSGEWADTDLLPNEVLVKTRLLLAPALPRR